MGNQQLSIYITRLHDYLKSSEFFARESCSRARIPLPKNLSRKIARFFISKISPCYSTGVKSAFSFFLIAGGNFFWVRFFALGFSTKKKFTQTIWNGQNESGGVWLSQGARLAFSHTGGNLLQRRQNLCSMEFQIRTTVLTACITHRSKREADKTVSATAGLGVRTLLGVRCLCHLGRNSGRILRPTKC